MTPLDRLRVDRPDSSPLADATTVARRGGWRGLGELARAWHGLVAKGARPMEAGVSVDGLPLIALEVGAPEATDVVCVLAGIHAMEWIGVEAASAILERLVIAPPDNRRALFFPLVNVDGYAAVEADLRAGRRRFRRANARGVDLNRNWPTHYKAFQLRSKLFPWIGSPGAHPSSEPETAAVLSCLDRALAGGARLVAALSLHSYGRMILYPYGGRWAAPEARDGLREAAGAMKARIEERYRIVQCARWVPGAFAHGMEIDHLHDHYGACALLVECGGGDLGLLDPASWAHPFRWFNPVDGRACVRGLVGALEAFVREAA